MIKLIIGVQGLVVLLMAINMLGQNKEIQKLEDVTWELLNNRNHISRIEQGEIEERGRNNLDLISQLANEVDKKIVRVYHTGYRSYVDTYTVVDLTEKERCINELKSKIKELEEEDAK